LLTLKARVRERGARRREASVGAPRQLFTVLPASSCARRASGRAQQAATGGSDEEDSVGPQAGRGGGAAAAAAEEAATPRAPEGLRDRVLALCAGLALHQLSGPLAEAIFAARYSADQQYLVSSFAFFSLKKNAKSFRKTPTITRETVSLNPYITQMRGWYLSSKQNISYSH
jgi:hypothetical protein